MTIEKLIKEYSKKVELLDSDTENLRGKIMSNGFDGVDSSGLEIERKVKQAERQIYFQTVKDLEDLV